MRIGVIGGGVVGHATARAFVEHAEVRVYDVVREKATHSLPETLDSDLVFVCLPTPQSQNGLAADLSFIHNFFATNHSTKTNFVLRSTVPIGTTRLIRRMYNLPNLIHSPEFLTARCAVADAQIPARNIIGGEQGKPSRETLHSLLLRRFPGVPVITMSSDESEAVKLFQNAFFATKIAFFNECYRLADKLDLDWETIMQGVLSDGRIAHSHTTVPGADGFGYSGSCLPKDIANLITCIQDAGCLAAVTTAALERNKVDRGEE